LPSPNTPYGQRYEIINAYSKPEYNYLEIGIEYGHTFSNVLFDNKTGVDPSHKVNPNTPEYYQIQKMTSDAFFKQFSSFAQIVSVGGGAIKPARFVPRTFRLFDVVFIDGMHHAENVVCDLNNSIAFLNKDGIIYLDDVLPISSEEQEKIPQRHKVEDGILKYVTPWTGDVWKVVYHCLLKYKSQFQYLWFHHPNYRGVFMFHHIQSGFKIPEDEIAIINGYSYETDFPNYIKELCSGYNVY
jgi:hypothetical protein